MEPLYYFNNENQAQITRNAKSIILDIGEIQSIIDTESSEWALQIITQYAAKVFTPTELAEFERLIGLLEDESAEDSEIRPLEKLIDCIVYAKNEWLRQNELAICKIAALDYMNQYDIQ